MRKINRRRMLRGMLGGAVVGLGLPNFDLFLNGNGNAYASGRVLPLRFGTWFWGCGMNPVRWNPSETGVGFALPPELAPLEPIREHVSVLSRFDVKLDGAPNHPHTTGALATLTGEAPRKKDDVPGPTLDVLISDVIGGETRFRSLEMTASAKPQESYSRRSASVTNPNEIDPVKLYQRLFGADFRDPNVAEFVPDPRVMLRQSVISAVKEDRIRLEQRLGSHDRARLDEYLTAVRQLEHQLELQLEQPPPRESCAIPEEPEAPSATGEIGHAMKTHDAMTKLLVMALACDQTRCFNMVFSPGASGLHRAGSQTGHHQLTHEEMVDQTLGYQPRAAFFVDRSMEAWASMVSALAAFPEGQGSLLDSCAVMAHSESSLAKTHDIVGLPFMIAGRAGGRIRPGVHVAGRSGPVSRIGLTMQQVMALPVTRWGVGSMETDRTITEILT